MPTLTPNYSLNKPNVNSADDEDLWGDQLNDNMDTIDTQLKTNNDLASPVTSTKTANYTLTASDNNSTILVDATSGNITVDGDATALGSGFSVTIIKTDSSTNTVTFDPTGGQTVNGEATTVISTQFGRKSVVTDGSNWFITAEDVGLADAAETLTGTSTTLATTPGGLAGNKDLVEDGYYKLPGGFVLQWGKETGVTSGTKTITWPEAFDNACIFATVQKDITTNAGGAERDSAIESLSTTQMTYQPWYSGAGGAVADVYWFAIGY